MAKVSCTCGCGQKVTNATKQNHLRGRRTTALRARVLTETESLRSTGQRQEQNPLQDRKKQKQSNSNADERGSRKRLKASQLEASPEPEFRATLQADADAIQVDAMDLHPAVVMQSSEVVKRTKRAMEQRWGAR
jgi:hypothetical protein